MLSYKAYMSLIAKCTLLGLLLVSWCGADAPAAADVLQTRETLTIRGRPQVLHLYGSRGGQPIIVASGDGGWIHLGPHVAEVLAAKARFVVGFDVKSYLESFTGEGGLRPQDVAGDYRALTEFAARGSTEKPILIGVSEGAGLAVLAASDESLKRTIAGVVALGLPDRNELAWRWKDSLIYVTHRAPNEPMFSTSAIIDRVAPVPLAAIHSTRDEFVPLTEARELLDRASPPKRLWVIDASDHRFSDKQSEFDQRLLEAITWIETARTQ